MIADKAAILRNVISSSAVEGIRVAAFPYPRPITQIHQLEPTTRCNLRCKYCPQFPVLPRPKEDMSADTFEATLKLVAHYVRRGTQGELSFTGIGEPTLHPDLVRMMFRAREVLGDDRHVVMSTNGLLFTDELAAAIAPMRPSVYVSLHRPEKAGLAIEVAKRHGVYVGRNSSFADSAFDWGGKVKWFVSHPRVQCEHLYQGWGIVLVDGRISTCCLDADGSGVVGTVWDDPATLAVKPFSLCDTCSFSVPRLVPVAQAQGVAA